MVIIMKIIGTKEELEIFHEKCENTPYHCEECVLTDFCGKTLEEYQIENMIKSILITKGDDNNASKVR